MAVAAVSVDALTKDERAVVVASLELKLASVVRSAKSEKNSAVVDLRVREAAAIEQLIAKFR